MNIVMNDVDITAFDDYWRTVTRNEEYICQYGHHGCPDWESKWHDDLEEAYDSVKPLLEPISEKRMIHDLPADLNSFDAENFHHALIKFLNPPERWFSKIGVLVSPEYLGLKQEVKNEQKAITTKPFSNGTTKSDSRKLELSQPQKDILEAMETLEAKNNQSHTWLEISDEAGYSYEVVRRHSRFLQEAGLVRKVNGKFILV